MLWAWQANTTPISFHFSLRTLVWKKITQPPPRRKNSDLTRPKSLWFHSCTRATAICRSSTHPRSSIVVMRASVCVCYGFGRYSDSYQSSYQRSNSWTSYASPCSISHQSRAISQGTGGSSNGQSRPPHAQEPPGLLPRNFVSADTRSPTLSARTGSCRNPTPGCLV